jgi:hypothetical protein
LATKFERTGLRAAASRNLKRFLRTPKNHRFVGFRSTIGSPVLRASVTSTEALKVLAKGSKGRSLRPVRWRTLVPSQSHPRGGRNNSGQSTHSALTAIRFTLEFQTRDPHQFLGRILNIRKLTKDSLCQLHDFALAFGISQLPELSMLIRISPTKATSAINLGSTGPASGSKSTFPVDSRRKVLLV